MNILKISLLSLAMLLVFGYVAAQETADTAEADIAEVVALDEEVTAEDLGVAEPNLLPDSPFYFLKNWGRTVQAVLTFDPIRKAELKEKFANEKLVEVKKMVEQNKNREKIEKAVQNYENEVEEAARATEKIRERAAENEQVGQFLDKFIRQRALQQRILHKLEEQVPMEVAEKIAEAREVHIEKFGEVMTRLENKENIQERLETNLQQVKGSEYKELKNLEVLKDLEEKVSEEAREAIQRAQANTLIRLKEKVEALPAEKIEQFQAYTERISGVKEKQLEILEDLKESLDERPTLQQKIIESSGKVLERIEVKERERATENTQACIQLWNPVCGKDGKTYSNSCFARLAGVEVAQEGKCPSSEQQIQTQTQTETQTQSQIRTQLETLQQQLKQLQSGTGQ